MSVRLRLTWIFIAIVFPILVVAGFGVRRVVVDELRRRAEASLTPAADATVSLFNERARGIEERVRAVLGGARFARVLERDGARAVPAFLRRAIDSTDGVDFLLVLDENGKHIGYAEDLPEFVNGFVPPRPRDILTAEVEGRGFYRTPEIPVAIPGRGIVSRVIGGFWLDEEFLAATARGEAEASLAYNDVIFSTTIPLGGPRRVDVPGRPTETRIGGSAVAQSRRLVGDIEVITSTSAEPVDALSRQIFTSLLFLLALALAGIAIFAYFLAKRITGPLHEVARGAEEIARGNLGYRIPVMSRDEVGQLAVAFNEMTGKLERTINDLSSSRDQLQRAVRRVGQVLRSRNDIRQIFDSILHTVADAIEADAAVLWTFSPNRQELTPKVMIGTGSQRVGHVEVGQGVAGLVAERGRTVVVDGRGGVGPGHAEPRFPVAMAVPLISDERIQGVISTYRTDIMQPFSEGDLETVIFLAEQGGVALENVALHEEAQRLSLTDGLTGTFNRRYFQMQFRQVLATSTRFDRPFSVLMLDLDHFKRVNDTFGHQRGDEILVEFSQRVTRVLREVDTFARYGGEEFICLLSETDRHGALTTAEKIREAIRSDEFGESGEVPIHLTVSIGIASYPDHGENYRTLVEAADKGLYQAKQAGRDRVCVVGEGPSQLKLAK